jgi:hypothetical protein
LKLARSDFVEHHVTEPVRRVRDGEQAGQFAARLGGAADGDQLAGRVLAHTGPGSVDHLAQFLGQLTVPQLRLVRSYLHRDGQELSIIATDVRLDECLELVGAGHEEIRVGLRYARLDCARLGPESNLGSALWLLGKRHAERRLLMRPSDQEGSAMGGDEPVAPLDIHAEP